MEFKETLLNWADANPKAKELKLNEVQFNQFLELMPDYMKKIKFYQFMSRQNRPIRVYLKSDAKEI